MKIEQLEYGIYQGEKFQVEYITKAYQDIKIKKRKKSIHITLKRKRMRKATKKYETVLFADYIENPICFAMIDKKQIIGFIEGEFIEWNNTFRIWEIFVHQKNRRRGIGNQLFKHMERHILDTKARAIVLEVQSCNDPAISFYEKLGMHFIGLNTMAYTDYDIQNKEVRLEYGKRLG